MADDPLVIAAAAARGFALLQCDECAIAIRNGLLAAGHAGQWLELRTGSGRDYIVCISYDGGQQVISENGRHVGVRVGELVFDNLHPVASPSRLGWQISMQSGECSSRRPFLFEA